MKRRDFLQHLWQHGCQFVREGGEHSIWENPATNHRVSIPRHREIPDYTARRICIQLGIPEKAKTNLS
jgi:predicted RNA binding protein YcfA (HicA-like mRNA interferase family)